jgi:hypothetical protein
MIGAGCSYELADQYGRVADALPLVMKTFEL